MLRRSAGPALVGSGVFLLALAVLLPTVVYPRIAVLPADPRTARTAKGSGFTVLVPRSPEEGGFRVHRDAGVTSQLWVTADPGGSPGENDVNWRVATSVSVDGAGLLSATVEGVSLDRRTARTTNCCRDYVITDYDDVAGEPVRHEGYAFTFPFDVQKQDYPIWDVNIRGTEPARYAGEETRLGVDVYRFEQTVPEQKIGTQELPADVMGLPPGPSVVADSMYTTRRTYWVEPNSGAIVDYRETLDRRFVYADRVVPIVQGTLSSVHGPGADEPLEAARSAAASLPMMRRTLPLVLAPLGLACLVAGAALAARRHRRHPAATRDVEERALTGAGA
jgi:hypothetical protein